MKNKKVNIELDLEDLLGLKEPSKDSLEYDLLFAMENGIDEYVKLRENERNKDKEFVELFQIINTTIIRQKKNCSRLFYLY